MDTAASLPGKSYGSSSRRCSLVEALVQFARGVRARIVHFTAVDSGAERRRTLQTLIELAAANNPGDCFDDGDAARLLRSQSNPDELRALGMSEEMIATVFPESHER
jgi:hypothetical protein